MSFLLFLCAGATAVRAQVDVQFQIVVSPGLLPASQFQ